MTQEGVVSERVPPFLSGVFRLTRVGIRSGYSVGLTKNSDFAYKN